MQPPQAGIGVANGYGAYGAYGVMPVGMGMGGMGMGGMGVGGPAPMGMYYGAPMQAASPFANAQMGAANMGFN